MTTAPATPRRMTAAFAAAIMTLSLAQVSRAASMLSVVVTGSSAQAAAESVRDAGGTVGEMLPIVDGVAARIPSTSVGLLSRHATVVADRPLRTQSASYGGALATVYPHEVGATATWAAGNAGAGVSVALIDTGIADVADLRGRVIASADVSGDASGGDGYGHGTFLAGLVAGDGTASGGRYTGIAPAANLVSIKVARADGSTNLSRVLLGVQLARSSAARFNTRVLLLALSSESPMPPDLDPLSLALRRAWASGIVVVVPAGNDGPASGSVASPGEDPVLLTVGSVDDRGTTDVFDDLVSPWSARGVTRWGDPKPDVAAPGEHLVGLRAPGSTVDRANPGSVVEGAYFKGSGTSMSAAVAAGAAALLIAERPDYSPDDVKYALMAGATPIPDGDADSVGAGVVEVASALEAGRPSDLPPVPGQGEDDESKPSGKWESADGAQAWIAKEKNFDKDAEKAWEWAGRQWASDRWDEREWAGRQWAGRQWAGRQWAHGVWLGRQWAGRQWAGRQWATQEWLGRQWSGRQWAGRQWTEAEWLGRQWSGRQWSAGEWEGRQWSGRQWSGRQWSGRQWSSDRWG